MMKQDKMEEQWLEEIRQTLAHHEEELPADGWEKLAAAMASAEEAEPAIPTPQPKSPRLMPVWLKRVAAVLLVGVIAIGGAYFFSDSPEVSSPIVATAPEDSSDEESMPNVEESYTEPESLELEPSAVAANLLPKPAIDRTPNTELAASQEPEKETPEEPEAPNEPTDEPQAIEPAVNEPQQEPASWADIHQEENAVLLAMAEMSAQASAASRSWSIGMRLVRNGSSDFGFGNTLDNDSYCSGSEMATPSPIDSTLENASNRAQTRADNTMLPDDVMSSDNHHSWSAGISVSKQLNQFLALESGLVYTYLSSDVTLRHSGRQHQQLHYLGIPLKLTATIAEDGRWRFYSSVGTMLEHSLYGQRDTRNLHLNDWQWSMDGGLGVQYKLTGHMGLYLEPGVNYYFSNGSDVPSLRTESPFSVNLQIGIRFGL